MRGGVITQSRIPVNGARVYSVPAAAGTGSSFDPTSDQNITGAWDFTQLTVSGQPVATGTSGGGGSSQRFLEPARVYNPLLPATGTLIDGVLYDDNFIGNEDDPIDTGRWTVFDPGSNLTEDPPLIDGQDRVRLRTGNDPTGAEEVVGIYQESPAITERHALYTRVANAIGSQTQVETFQGIIYLEDKDAPTTSNILLLGTRMRRIADVPTFEIGAWEFTSYTDTSPTQVSATVADFDAANVDGLYLNVTWFGSGSLDRWDIHYSFTGEDWYQVAGVDRGGDTSMTTFDAFGLGMMEEGGFVTGAVFNFFRGHDVGGTVRPVPAGFMYVETDPTASGSQISGGGGGGSTDTLQDAYDNGDGTITTVAGKPLHITGDEYDGNVDFQVTGSGKFTESLQVGSGTVWIDGDKVQTPSLIVDGSPITSAIAVDGFSGATVRLDANQSVANVTNYIVQWDELVSDTDGYVDLGSDNTILTVPEGIGITHVKLQAQMVWNASTTAGRRVVQFQKNGASIMDGKLHRTDHGVTSAGHLTQQTDTLSISAAPGDTFRVLVFQDSGGALDVTDATLNSSSWFSIERANPVAVSGTEFTSISGTFTESLTVSGVPVNIGAGGGAGTITDINTVATGPSVTITGAGGISTVTEGNTITVSGLGTYMPGFRGAEVTSTSGIDIPHNTTVFLGTGAIPFDQVNYDTDGFFDVDHQGRFVIPAGINKVKVLYTVAWPENSTGERTAFASLNGTSVSSSRIAASPTSETVQRAESGVIDVSEGDIITPGLRQESGVTLTTNPNTNIAVFALEVVDPAPTPGFVGKQKFNGALLALDANQSISNATNTELVWAEPVSPWYDTDGWVDGPSSSIVVPEGVTKVRVNVTVVYQQDVSQTGYRQLWFSVNDLAPVGRGFSRMLPVGGTSDVPHVLTGVFPVQAGDVIKALTYQNSGGSLDVVTNNSTFIQIEAVETNSSFQIDEFTAVSGTFNESLTVSGVPVNIGSGGGSGVTKYQQMFTDQTTVSVTHNIGSIVHMITILDDNNYVIDATIQYGENTDTVTFSESQSGSAIVMG